MKAALALLAAAPIVLAQPEITAEPRSLSMPGYEQPPRQWRSVEDALPAEQACRDTIRQARAENGQPALRRETADPDQPLLIAAVDHRIDGCSVMVMRRDTSDVRPLPTNPDSPAQLIPAR